MTFLVMFVQVLEGTAYVRQHQHHLFRTPEISQHTIVVGLHPMCLPSVYGAPFATKLFNL